MTRVLVVDDDRSIGEVIQASLARQNCETVLALDGYSGIRAFDSSEFDLAIVDIFLPSISGLEMIGRIRQRTTTMPILAMSGFRFRGFMNPQRDFLHVAATLGATFCLPKPFSPQQLMAALAAAFGRPFLTVVQQDSNGS